MWQEEVGAVHETPEDIARLQALLDVSHASAGAHGFTPAFQALLPDVLPDEARYTRGDLEA